MENIQITPESKTNETEKKGEGFGAKFKGMFGNITKTAKDSFEGIFNTTKDLVTKGAKEVKSGAITVSDEIKQTETAQKITETAKTAASETTNTFKQGISAVLGVTGEALNPIIDSEKAKLDAQVNIKKIEDIIGHMNIANEKRQGNDQELLVAGYNQLNKLIGANQNPNWTDVDELNQNIESLIKQYNEQLNKVNKTNPVSSDLDKLSSQAKVAEAKVTEAKVSEAKVTEAKVAEAKVSEAKKNDVSV